MDNNTRSIYGSYIQTCLSLKVDPEYKEFTRVNEKLSILASTLPSAGEFPSIACYVIGNGGHSFSVGANGIAKPEPVVHRGTDASLYNQLPFVLRETNNDLSPVQRAKYCLRRTETHNGTSYIAYYGRRIDKTNLTVTMEEKNIQNGQETSSSFVPTASNLNPTPPAINNNGTNTVDGDYTTVAARLNLSLTADDIAEFKNVAQIIYNDEGYAIISEIGLCYSVDRVITVNASNGGTFNFNETIATQIASFVSTLIPASAANNGTSVALDVGATEPLWSFVG